MLQSEKFYTTIELNSLSKQVLASLPSQVAIINSDGDVIAHNNKWASKASSVPEKWAFPLLGDNVLEVLQTPLAQANDYALRFIMAYKSVLSGESSELKVHFPIQLDDRKWFSLTISVLEDKKHFLLICTDISKEMMAKSNLNESSVRYQKQFQNKLYGVLIADENFNILEANKTATQILGVPFSALKERPLDYFLRVKTT